MRESMNQTINGTISKTINDTKNETMSDLVFPIQSSCVMITGSTRAVSSMLLSLAIKLQAIGIILCLDTVEAFGPELMHERMPKTRCSLRNLQLAQPMTVEQFKKLITKLDKKVRGHDAKAIIITAFDRLFEDDIENKDDRYFEAVSCLEELKRVGRKYHIPILIGTTDSKTTEFLATRVDMVCNV